MVTKEQRKGYIKKYYLSHRDKIRKQRQRYSKEHPVEMKRQHLKKFYGITFEQMRQMYISQNGFCPICLKKFKSSSDMHIDHNHSNGQIREILCSKCNSGIGFLREDILILNRAIDYLRKWNSSI